MTNFGEQAYGSGLWEEQQGEGKVSNSKDRLSLLVLSSTGEVLGARAPGDL